MDRTQDVWPSHQAVAHLPGSLPMGFREQALPVTG